jgi:hypothetical protein
MSIESAALLLDSCLSKDGLRVTVECLGDEEIMVYLHGGVGETIIPPQWKGYKVNWTRLGKIETLRRKQINSRFDTL